MRIILSPAKNMVVSPGREVTAPRFREETASLLAYLRGLSPEALQKLWGCSDSLAAQNTERLASMDLTLPGSPALFTYDGMAYRQMAPETFPPEALAYSLRHLRILSGFYGLLSPLDGITPYRLEMGSRLPGHPAGDLYRFWGAALARALEEETELIINLASKEYSKAVLPHLKPDTRVITCSFLRQKNGKLREESTACKKARGEMVRYMALGQITDPAALRNFCTQGYRFAPEHSDSHLYTFIKED